MSQPIQGNPLSFDPPQEIAGRRRFLIGATAAVGGAGALFTAYPFVDSMEPSARARALGAPVEVDTARLAPGDLVTVGWRGKPVWVMRRTPAMITALEAANPVLADPMSRKSAQPAGCDNPTRSLKPDLFVAVGVCTHLGCSPTLRLNDAALNEELHGPGGFYCPCHGSKFDLAGRVVKDMPAPTNLVIPPYEFTGVSGVKIG